MDVLEQEIKKIVESFYKKDRDSVLVHLIVFCLVGLFNIVLIVALFFLIRSFT
jgi:hypothetical protein